MAVFTPGELEVMEVLWQHGPLKPAQIEQHMPRPISNAALRSVLRVLLSKGHVIRHKVGKAYHYRPKHPPHAALQNMARRMADAFCGGSSFALIAQLIKTEPLSEDDIRELQRLANHRAPKPESNNGETDT